MNDTNPPSAAPRRERSVGPGHRQVQQLPQHVHAGPQACGPAQERAPVLQTRPPGTEGQLSRMYTQLLIP